MSRTIIACRTSSYAPHDSIALAHMASVGIRNVEVMLPEPDAAAAVRSELDGHGLTASSVHGRCDVQRPDLAQDIAAQGPILKALGSQFLFVSCKADETPLDTVYGRLREAGDAAAEAGFTIVMETHPDLVTNADTALQTMRAIDHPRVRVNFDTGNIYFYNHGLDTPTELRKIIDYVGAVHLKDTDGGYRNWHFPALGLGIVDFEAVFRILDDAGFSGPCTLEVEGIEGEERTEEVVRNRVAASAEYLRGLGRL